MTQVASYDFRCNEEMFDDFAAVQLWLTGLAKHYYFQLEKGDSGYIHWQGRMSLIKKRRKPELLKLLTDLGKSIPHYLQPTAKASLYPSETFYAMKDDTRLLGPWTDKDVKLYIPRQIREIKKLYDWQQSIVDDAGVWDTRTVNLVYCPDGNKGKTTLVGWCRANGVARVLPSVNECKDILRMVCDMPTATMYLFDMPRCMNKEKLYGFYSAIETIKDGYAYDDRYAFKEKVFDCPNIWIFSNIMPDDRLLSRDRWKIWRIDDALKSLQLISLTNI